MGREAVARYFLAAPLLENANAVVVMSAVFDRTLHKYGPRGYRYILIEAGHAAQNLCLLSAERNLATLCVGGFVDSGSTGFSGSTLASRRPSTASALAIRPAKVHGLRDVPTVSAHLASILRAP